MTPRRPSDSHPEATPVVALEPPADLPRAGPAPEDLTVEGSPVGYDGESVFPPLDAPPSTREWHVQVAVTLLLVAGPVLGLVLAVVLAWGRGVGVVDLALLAVLYVVTGLGIAVGYHRGLTHRSYASGPVLRAVLASAGAMAFEGDPVSWVATHRRHHAFTDRPGDPHSPYRFGTGAWAQTRGLVDAHIGWLFRHDETDADHWAPDLVSDPAVRMVARLFPVLCVVSLLVPFGLGLAITGTLSGALLTLLWAGLVRVALLQHVTWSVNSLCHVFGSRPFVTRPHDRATNLWPLAIPSFGESWHNAHHADPTCARHGVDRGQVDIAAWVIRGFERLGWVRDVRWPGTHRAPERRPVAVDLR